MELSRDPELIKARLAATQSRRIKCSDIPIGEIIEACRAFRAGRGPMPDIALAHKYPVKVIMAKMQKLVDRGILNYGVSLRTAWVEADHHRQD